MKPNSLIMILIGIALGVGLTLIGLSVGASPAKIAKEQLIQADGFRNITFYEGKFHLDLVSRIDADTVEVSRRLEVPTDGFLRGYSAMEELIDRLVADGILKKTGVPPIEAPQ